MTERLISWITILCILYALTIVSSEVSYSQTPAPFYPGIKLQDNASRTLTLRTPVGGLGASYSLSFPAAAPGAGALLFTGNGTGGLNWLGVGTNGYILSVSGGLPLWSDPVGLLQGSFVRYNVSTSQGTATGGNRLFDLAYSALGAGINAPGARIVSASGTGAGATGLDIAATANGVGTATGLSVSATGGTNQYAAIFTNGNVGIGTGTPGAKLHVQGTASGPSDNVIMAEMDYVYSGAATNTGGWVHANAVRMYVNNGTPLTSQLVTALDAGVAFNGTANVTRLNGIRGFINSGTASNTITGAYAVNGHFQNVGTITNGASFLASVINTSPGTISNYAGLLVQNPVSPAGAMTNVIGVDINELNAGAVSNTAIRYNHSTTPFVVTGAGRVGIGTGTPLCLQDVLGGTITNTTQTPSNWTSNFASQISQTVNPSGAVGAFYHTLMAHDSLTVTGTANMSNGVAIARLSRVRYLNTNTINEVRGVQSNIQNEDLGTITAANAFFANGINSAKGVIETFNGFNMLISNTTLGNISTVNGLYARADLAGSGNIGLFNGVNIESPAHSSTGQVQNYNGVIVQNISTAEVSGTRNAFKYNGSGTNVPVVVTGDGRVGIGITAPNTLLDVDGGVTIRPAATVSVGSAGNIAVGNRSYLRLNPTASVTVGFAAGTSTGQILYVEVLNNGTNTLTFKDAGAQNLELEGGDFNPANAASLTLMWNGTIWIELARRTLN